MSEALCIEEFGGMADAEGRDNTPALNAALTAARERGAKTVAFGRGTYHFHTPPDEICFGIDIVGHGKQRTTLVRAYSVDADSPHESLIKLRTGADGSTVRDLGIVAERASRGGSAISLVASEAGAPDYCSFRDLYLSSLAGPGEYTWDTTVLVDGTMRTGSPFGVRDTGFSNCNVFGARDHAVALRGAVALSFTGGGVFRAGGRSGNVEMSGAEAVPSQYVVFDVASIDSVSLDRCIYCHVRAAAICGPIRNTPNTYGCLTLGAAAEGVQDNWTASRHIDSTP